MPLAIELAASRVRSMAVQELSSRLDDRFHLLTGGARTALPRQRTLEATITWSYDLLSEQERVLFDRLSVFSGGVPRTPPGASVPAVRSAKSVFSSWWACWPIGPCS